MTTHILWAAHSGDTFELCRLTEGDGGARLAGTALRSLGAVPYEIRYEIETDALWRTRALDAHVSGPDGERRLRLRRAETWLRDDAPLGGFEDCLDVDLEFSPCTNTLPIRRCSLGVGERERVVALWISVPGFELERLEQSYERIAEDRYGYRAGDFAAELTVDESGLVLDYEGYFGVRAVWRR